MPCYYFSKKVIEKCDGTACCRGPGKSCFNYPQLWSCDYKTYPCKQISLIHLRYLNCKLTAALKQNSNYWAENYINIFVCAKVNCNFGADIPNPSRQGPGQHVLADPAWAVGSCTRWSQEVSSNLNTSVLFSASAYKILLLCEYMLNPFIIFLSVFIPLFHSYIALFCFPLFRLYVLEVSN